MRFSFVGLTSAVLIGLGLSVTAASALAGTCAKKKSAQREDHWPISKATNEPLIAGLATLSAASGGDPAVAPFAT